MINAAIRLEKILNQVPQKLLQISEEEASFKKAPGKWSKKELLGHLIDSASNNHQRFVRMPLENELSLQQYEQDNWVAVQEYQKLTWAEIVNFWKFYNIHLLHVLKHMDESKLKNTASFPSYGVKTLQFIVDDYVDHMEYHLKQLLDKPNRQ